MTREWPVECVFCRAKVWTINPVCRRRRCRQLDARYKVSPSLPQGDESPAPRTHGRGADFSAEPRSASGARDGGVGISAETRPLKSSVGLGLSVPQSTGASCPADSLAGSNPTDP